MCRCQRPDLQWALLAHLYFHQSGCLGLYPDHDDPGHVGHDDPGLCPSLCRLATVVDTGPQVVATHHRELAQCHMLEEGSGLREGGNDHRVLEQAHHKVLEVVQIQGPLQGHRALALVLHKDREEGNGLEAAHRTEEEGLQVGAAVQPALEELSM